MKKAFTVSELLVTMAIIGVIAMLVLPSFLKDYHKRIYTTKFKKTYEVLFSAMEQACIDNNVSYFNQTPYAKPNDSDKQAEFINKYFKVAENAKTEGDSPFAPVYKTINSEADAEGEALDLSAGASARLKGGEVLAIMCETTTECIVTVDINSAEGPNTGGRDLFQFRLDTENNKVISNVDSATCGTDIYGRGCLSKLLEDNWVMKY